MVLRRTKSLSAQKFRTSNWETFVHLVKGNVGTGCLALPFCFSMLGPFWSIIGLGITGTVCVYNMWLVVECKNSLVGAHTYGELGFAAFGKNGEFIVESFLILMQLSVCCVYFTFIGSNINALLPNGGSLFYQQIIMTILIFPIAILSQLKSIRQLAPLSVFATLILCIALGIIFIICCERIMTNDHTILPVADFSKMISFFTITIYSFEGVGIILPIEDAMETPDDFCYILSMAMATVGLIFILLAELSIFAFGSIDQGSITSYLQLHGPTPPSVTYSLIITLVNLLISLAVLLTYPLQLYPAVQVLEVSLNLIKPKTFTISVEVDVDVEVEQGRGRGRGCVNQGVGIMSISPPHTKDIAIATMKSRAASALSFFTESTSPVYKKIRKSDRFGHEKHNNDNNNNRRRRKKKTNKLTTVDDMSTKYNSTRNSIPFNHKNNKNKNIIKSSTSTSTCEWIHVLESDEENHDGGDITLVEEDEGCYSGSSDGHDDNGHDGHVHIKHKYNSNKANVHTNIIHNNTTTTNNNNLLEASLPSDKLQLQKQQSQQQQLQRRSSESTIRRRNSKDKNKTSNINTANNSNSCSNSSSIKSDNKGQCSSNNFIANKPKSADKLLDNTNSNNSHNNSNSNNNMKSSSSDQIYTLMNLNIPQQVQLPLLPQLLLPPIHTSHRNTNSCNNSNNNNNNDRDNINSNSDGSDNKCGNGQSTFTCTSAMATAAVTPFRVRMTSLKPSTTPCSTSTSTIDENSPLQPISSVNSILSNYTSDNGDYDNDNDNGTDFSSSRCSSPMKIQSSNEWLLYVVYCKDFFKSRGMFRVVLVSLTALIAILIPNVGLLISLAGASSGSALSMIIPPLIDMKINRESISIQRLVMNFFSIFIGSLGAIIGTFVAIRDIFSVYG
eukprot:gene9708-20185_t